MSDEICMDVGMHTQVSPSIMTSHVAAFEEVNASRRHRSRRMAEKESQNLLMGSPVAGSGVDGVGGAEHRGCS